MRRKRSGDFILRIQLVPKPLHGINLRIAIGKDQWQKKLRARLLSAQKKPACRICGVKPEKPPDLEAHEEWSYDTSSIPAVAQIETISLICESCHRCEHFIHTMIMVRDGIYSPDALDAAVAHFCRVNKTTNDEFNRHLREAIDENKRLSGIGLEDWEVSFGRYNDLVDEKVLERLEAKIQGQIVVVTPS